PCSISRSKRSSGATSCACSTRTAATSSPRRRRSTSIARRCTASCRATASTASLDMGARPIPAAWPSLLALALVVVLSIASLAAALYIDRPPADRPSELVDNSLPSIALADALRYQAYRLSAPALDPARLASIANEIAVDARAYEPIATDEGE